MQPIHTVAEAIIGDAMAVPSTTWSGSDRMVGLLINFNVTRLTDGVSRAVLGYEERRSATSLPLASSAIDSVDGG